MPALALVAATIAAAVAQAVEDDAALCLDAYLLFLAAVVHMFELMSAAGGRAPRRAVAVSILLPLPLIKFGAAAFLSSSAVRFRLGDFMLFTLLSLLALQVPGDAPAGRARRLLEKLHFLTAAAFFLSGTVDGRTGDARLRSFDVLVLLLAGVAVMFVRLWAAAGVPATRVRSRALVAVLPFLLARLGAAGAVSTSSLIYRIKVDALTTNTVLLFRRAWIAGGTGAGESHGP